MIAVKIDFDDAEFIRFTETLTPAAIERAMKRATKKAAQWSRTHIGRRVKDQIDLPRKIIVSRVRVYDKGWRNGGGGGPAVKVWFGIDPVKADRVAKPVKTSKGYRVKQWDFPGGFMPPSKPGKLFQRTTSKRLPIQRSKVEINVQGLAAFKEIEAQVPDRLRALAIQELRYEMHKEQGTL